MAPLRAGRSLASAYGSCLRLRPDHRNGFATTGIIRFDDIRSESRLPRVATGSFWWSLIPKPLRRPRATLEPDATGKPAKKREWNPYTTFILLAILIGSNAINMIALRNEMAAFSRKTDAKLALLREVVQKVKRGEIDDAEVKRALGTGDPEAEKEWEAVVKEIEETDVLAEAKKRKEARRAQKMEERRVREAAEREGASPVAREEVGKDVREGRPKFLM